MSIPRITTLADDLSTRATPALTWYQAAETGTSRIELSGIVLARWAFKVHHFLNAEGIDEGTVLLDATPTWRLPVWALGVWRAGLGLTMLRSHDTIAVDVTDTPHRSTADVVVALADDPMDLGFSGDLAGAVDMAEVASYPDSAPPAADVDPRAIALADASVRYSDIDSIIGVGSGRRVAFQSSSPWEIIRRSASIWRAGGSVVIIDPEITDPASLATQEDAVVV